MSDFEREIISCLNRFFRTRRIPGYASRPGRVGSPARYSDVLVDSPDPAYCLSIECKSIMERKMYFSQHFHAGKQDTHPVEAISDFLTRTGRTGFLAIEFRLGPKNASEAFLIPWSKVLEHYWENKGITIEDARTSIVLGKTKDGYVLETL